MDNMEEKLGAMLNNPQLMQQVMSMAQSLGQSQNNIPAPSPPDQSGCFPDLGNLDISALKKLSGIASQGTIDQEQKALLCALGPYLSHSRVEKLEKAMRAARMARLASVFLGQGGLQALTGR